METQDNFLENCLFFNTNALSRYLLKLAEKEFKPLNLSPAHATLLLLVYDTPGISPKELGQNLHLTPSTITRFVDALEKKGFVTRRSRGKSVLISPSPKGLDLKPRLAMAYKNFYLTYTRILGPDKARQLSVKSLEAHQTLAGFLNATD